MRFNGKKAHTTSSMTLCAPIFIFCRPDPFLHEKTAPISKSPTIFGNVQDIMKVKKLLVYGDEMRLNGIKTHTTSTMTLCALFSPILCSV